MKFFLLSLLVTVTLGQTWVALKLGDILCGSHSYAWRTSLSLAACKQHCVDRSYCTGIKRSATVCILSTVQDLCYRNYPQSQFSAGLKGLTSYYLPARLKNCWDRSKMKQNYRWGNPITYAKKHTSLTSAKAACEMNAGCSGVAWHLVNGVKTYELRAGFHYPYVAGWTSIPLDYKKCSNQFQMLTGASFPFSGHGYVRGGTTLWGGVYECGYYCRVGTTCKAFMFIEKTGFNNPGDCYYYTSKPGITKIYTNPQNYYIGWLTDGSFDRVRYGPQLADADIATDDATIQTTPADVVEDLLDDLEW